MSLSNTAETPITTIKLIADKNLAKTGLVQLYYYLNSISNYNSFDVRQFIDTRLDVNGLSVNGTFLFNSVNPTECSNGTHMFHFVVIDIYINITGEIRFNLRARMINQGYHNGWVTVNARISDGT